MFEASPAFTLSGVNGTERKRTPVAAKDGRSRSPPARPTPTAPRYPRVFFVRTIDEVDHDRPAPLESR